MRRLFVAVLLAEGTRAALARVPHARPPPGVKVAWVAERNLHLTLKFLGNVEDGRVSAVTAALRLASAGVNPFELRVQGLGAFPERGAPRVLWAGCRAPDDLLRLADNVDRALEDLGFERERRAFSPHVTLARVRGRARESLLPPGRADALFGVIPVTSFSLLESTLHPSGAVYEEVVRIELVAGG